MTGTWLRIEVERSGRWRGSPGGRRLRRRPKGEPIPFTRPVRGSLASGTFLAGPAALPLPDASAATVECLDIFAYVRDDEGLAAECRRILAPGGELRLRVPAAGPLAGFDAFNLFRYLVDITRRGTRPYETAELGWRRHYPETELLAMLGTGAFTVRSARRSGLGIAELLTFVAMLLFRWLRPSPDRYRAARRAIATVERLEEHLAVSFGTTLDLTLVRTPAPGDASWTAPHGENL